MASSSRFCTLNDVPEVPVLILWVFQCSRPFVHPEGRARDKGQLHRGCWLAIIANPASFSPDKAELKDARNTRPPADSVDSINYAGMQPRWGVLSTERRVPLPFRQRILEVVSGVSKRKASQSDSRVENLRKKSGEIGDASTLSIRETRRCRSWNGDGRRCLNLKFLRRS